jgi:hypothetical protein
LQGWATFFGNVEAGAAPGNAYPPSTLQTGTSGAVASSTSTSVAPIVSGDFLQLLQDHLNVQLLIRSYQVR